MTTGRAVLPHITTIAASTTSSAAPVHVSTPGATCSIAASASGTQTMPIAVIHTIASASVPLVNTVIRPICAGVTPDTPYTRARTAPPVSAPKPVALPSADPAIAPIHSATRGTLAAT